MSNSNNISLAECTKKLVKQYFDDLDDITHMENLHQYVMEEVEKPLLLSVLLAMKGNKVKTAKVLGINRNTLRKKINYYKLPTNDN